MSAKYALLGLIFLLSCSAHEKDEPKEVDAYVPVYIPLEAMRDVHVNPNKKLFESGKIYIKGNLLLINEPEKGVHIFDNTDPENPKRLNFVAIPGNQDIEMNGDLLYADNGLDLVTLSLVNPAEPKLINRVENVFSMPLYPPYQNVKFVCAEESKGYVISWVLDKVVNPNCRR
ncbi:hypothetical protein LAG90_04700 [Marinilongibacter aquaticus]|uniref:hypothetical protein n=1 Tax=Marinilongibacter aquaticus TaxID=2975157 RepID=UPI0021BD02A0|nr:hypothetical protein [Marinilongibacter aquaticus]UBM59947.1 hypothetical protein LAG90_04700 [Marinilongibacter aquaticus]